MAETTAVPDGEGEFGHVPVLGAAALEWLGPALEGGGPLVDCTLGAGGHSEQFLRSRPDLVVIGIDRDSQALEAAGRRLREFESRLRLVKANFADIDTVVRGEGYDQAAAILYDLGVSSPQLDRAGRGFGYRPGFSLDMRMDQNQELTAQDIVNKYSESELNDILWTFGEERYARRIARAVVRRRSERPFTDAGDLAEVVRSAIPAATRRTGPHPARRTFQALRIETNRELEALDASLDRAVEILRPDGRVAVISYHSLEDRIVKRKFRSAAEGCICPRDLPVCRCGQSPRVRILTTRPIRPSEEEIQSNPRSDSARMRVAAKLEEAA